MKYLGVRDASLSQYPIVSYSYRVSQQTFLGKQSSLRASSPFGGCSEKSRTSTTREKTLAYSRAARFTRHSKCWACWQVRNNPMVWPVLQARPLWHKLLPRKKSHFIIPITYFRGFCNAMLGLFYSRKESSLRKGIKFTPATTRNLPALLVYLLSINSNLNYLRRVKNSTTVRPPLFLSTLKDKGVKYNSYLLWM